MTNNKIQVIYRLENLVTLFWPVRPNDSNNTSPESYNLYWSNSVSGTYSLIGSVENRGSSNRAYHKKVVFNVIPSRVGGWDNSNTNWVKIAAVIGGVEQAAETPIAINPHSVDNMLLKYPFDRTVIVGYNSDENKLVPVSVDQNGKVKTV